MLGHARRLAIATLSLLVLSNFSTVYAYDLEEIWRLALQRDPIYNAAGHRKDAEQEILPQARAQLLPFITASATAQSDDVRRTSTLGHVTTDKRALWSVNLSQPLVDIRAWRAMEQAQYASNAAKVDFLQARQALILRVSQAYFDVLAAQDVLRALQAEKQAVETQLQAAQQSFELGSTTSTDAHEAQARLDLVNAREHDAKTTLENRLDALASIIAESPGELAELDPDASLAAPEPESLDAWIAQATQTNLAVTRAELSMLIAEKQRDIAKSEYYPRVHLQAQTGTASDRGIYGTGPDPGPRSLDSSVGIVLSMPLYTGGELSSVVREQSSRTQQARAEWEAAKRVAEQTTKEHFSRVLSGRSQVAALQAAEKSSLAALEANQLAYEVGVRINIDVLNAQQQLYETQRALSQARYDTLMHSLRLKASSGTLSDSDLIAINRLLK